MSKYKLKENIKWNKEKLGNEDYEETVNFWNVA